MFFFFFTICSYININLHTSQHILVDERDDKHMESHIRLDVVLWPYVLRLVPLEHTCTFRGQSDSILVANLFSSEFLFCLSKNFISIFLSLEIFKNFASLYFQCCMILSSIYHTFSCRSEKDYWCYLGFDLFGIALSLLAIYMSGVYYAFWCHRVIGIFFSIIILYNDYL